MSLSCYLAMTEAEIRAAATLPDHLAFMACHFSPYGIGLVNIPQRLPRGSILIVNDRVPVLHHDPQVVLRQLQEVGRQLSLRGILLDFEIPNCQKEREIVGHSEIWRKKSSEMSMMVSIPIKQSEQRSIASLMITSKRSMS